MLSERLGRSPVFGAIDALERTREDPSGIRGQALDRVALIGSHSVEVRSAWRHETASVPERYAYDFLVAGIDLRRRVVSVSGDGRAHLADFGQCSLERH